MHHSLDSHSIHRTVTSSRRVRHGLRAALAVGLVALAGTGTATSHAAAPPVGDRPRFDAGPPWAPDDGLLCSILERYGAADEHTCPTEPIGSTPGPR